MKKLLITICILFLCSPLWATTATFQQGVDSYAGASDCSIRTNSTNEHITNGGTRVGGTYFFLLHFDISSIPSTATVSSATVQLYIAEQNCTDETVNVIEIEDPDGSGVFADNETADDVFNSYATYLYKNDTDNTDWSVAESVSFADVDDNATESSNTTGSCPGSVAKTWSVTTMVSGWVADSSTNAGMFFKLNDGVGNALIKNKRDATSSIRPLLTVEYTEASASRRVILVQ
jgi:hypothetical protein